MVSFCYLLSLVSLDTEYWMELVLDMLFCVFLIDAVLLFGLQAVVKNKMERRPMCLTFFIVCSFLLDYINEIFFYASACISLIDCLPFFLKKEPS